MEIPYYIFLFPYFIAILVILLFALFNLYHVYRYALSSKMSIAVSSVFVIGLLLMFGVSSVYIFQFDWTQTFSIVIGL